MSSRLFSLCALVAVVLAGSVSGGSRVRADEALPLLSEPAKQPEKPAARPFIPPPFPISTPVPKPKPKMSDAQKLLAHFANQKVCQAPLDLSVQNATLEEIAARIQKRLVQPAPRIEVRGARPIRLSFALKNSTVGDALGSAATLAGARLWIFDDHLLLAPETALTTEERMAFTTGNGNQWKPSKGVAQLGFAFDSEVRRVFGNLIGDELRAGFASAPATKTSPEDKTSPGKATLAKTVFSQLSPQAKEMLQLLVEQSNEFNASQRAAFGGSRGFTVSSLTLSPDSIVELNSMDPALNAASPDLMLQIINPTTYMHWSLSGNGWGFGGGSGTSRPLPPKPSAPPFLDPSANKS